MSDHQSLTEQQYIPASDGWDDAAAEASERMIRGELLKSAPIGAGRAKKEATPVADGTRLVALQRRARHGSGGKTESQSSPSSVVPASVCPSARISATTTKKQWNRPRRRAPRTRGRIHAWSTCTSSIPKPPKPTPSRPRRGADAAQLSRSSDTIATCVACAPDAVGRRAARGRDADQIRQEVKTDVQIVEWRSESGESVKPPTRAELRPQSDRS